MTARGPSDYRGIRRPAARVRLLVAILLAMGALVGCSSQAADAPVETDAPGPIPVPVPVPVDPALVFDGPIVITSGGTYRGNWESDDPDVPAVTIATSEPVRLESVHVRGPGHLVSVSWARAHVTLRDVVGHHRGPTGAGRYPGRFLHVEDFVFVDVERSEMVGTSGIYLYRAAPGATVRIVGNRAFDIDGRRSDGQGGYEDAKYVQFVQINGGDALTASVIAWNEVVNRPFQGRVEDVISLYKVSGRADDPIRVHDNFIRGAYPSDPRTDAFSGGGIMIGDGGGAHVHAYDNHVVSTSNYGIAIAGGTGHRVYGNRVVSCGRLPDGSPIASQNVGIYIWNIGRDADFRDNAGYGNLAGWVGAGSRNDWWVPDASVWRDNVAMDAGRPIPCSAEDAEHEVWRLKVVDAGRAVGPLVD